MSTLSVCPERIKVGRNSLLLLEVRISLLVMNSESLCEVFFFLMRIGDFKSASFSYHISSQIGLLSSSRNMQEGRKEALGCLLYSAANLS